MIKLNNKNTAVRKVLLLGSTGQVGLEVTRLFEMSNKFEVIAPVSSELNLEKMVILIDSTANFDMIINCAAFTDVRKCEIADGRIINQSLNAILPQKLGILSKKLNIPLIHISTDYVFDGKVDLKNGIPSKWYTEQDTTNPLQNYGRMKLIGEQNIKEITPFHYIIRTSWVFSEVRKNFVKFIYESNLDHVPELDIIMDQWGRPTSAIELAEVIFEIANDADSKFGTYHYGGSLVTTWFNFAKLIQQKLNKSIKLNQVSADTFNGNFIRPKNCVLNIDKIRKEFNIRTLNTELYLDEIIKRLKTQR